MNREIPGFCCIDKPRGISSFAVVAAARRALRCRKIGHAGTLDPAASGLLVLASGDATRLLPFMPLEPKVYRFGVRFGVETDTLDAEGTITRSGGAIPSTAALEEMVSQFIGKLSQVPPQFSAVKIRGVRSYRLARQGRGVELAPRQIEVFSLRVERYDESAGEALLDVSCSGGTYVRSLARDIAGKLGTWGYASSVRRNAAGNFHVDQALAYDNLHEIAGAMITISDAVVGLPRTVVDAKQEKLLGAGGEIIVGPVSSIENNQTGKPVFAFDNEKKLIAVLKTKDGISYQPVRVFSK